MDGKDTNLKKCNYCGEDIMFYLRRCPYCGSLLTQAEGSNVSGTIQDNSLNDDSDGEICQSAEKTVPEVTQPAYNYRTGQNMAPHSLSNGMKVFITIISVTIPGLGQLAGIIIALLLMNTENDPDRRSFGTALLMASVIFFVVSSLLILLILLILFARQVVY